MDDILIYWAKN